MSPTDRNDPDEVKERSRSRKDAPGQGIGGEEEGVRLPASGSTEDDQASFLGVDEPAVPPEDQGEPPPDTPLPSRPKREAP